jgi:hypothetical protein
MINRDIRIRPHDSGNVALDKKAIIRMEAFDEPIRITKIKRSKTDL